MLLIEWLHVQVKSIVLMQIIFRFAKNLSADSIQLSTLKGEGELSNLELDCVAIQNLLDLPTWLQINHANCNRVHVKVFHKFLFNVLFVLTIFKLMKNKEIILYSLIYNSYFNRYHGRN